MSYKQLEGVWTVNVSVFDVVDVGTQLGEEGFGVNRGGFVEQKHRCRRTRADGLEPDAWTGNEGAVRTE